MERYQDLVNKEHEFKTMVQRVHMEIFFVQLGISKEVFEKSMKTHFNEPAKVEDLKAAKLEGAEDGRS
jgi:hypothetical protein